MNSSHLEIETFVLVCDTWGSAWVTESKPSVKMGHFGVISQCQIDQYVDHLQNLKHEHDVTGSHKMVYKSHFGTTEILYILKEEKMLIIVVKKMIVVSAKIKKLWRVKVSGGESSHFEKKQFKVVQHILGVFS